MIEKYINLTKEKNLDIYKNPKYNVYFNEYNKKTVNKLNYLQNIINQPYFHVPYFDKKTIWGKERIFYPFTDKLFKIIDTTINDTSIQLHPLKNEKWYPLKSSHIYDGINWCKVNNKNIINIKINTIHCMKKGSRVFEIQDNNLFDTKETIRIYDINGRQTDDETIILKNLMPKSRNSIDILDNKVINKIINDNDLFIFVIKGKVELNLKENIVKFNKNELYYINKNYVKNIIIDGVVAICDVVYYL